jgi:hypothetical protein
MRSGAVASVRPGRSFSEPGWERDRSVDARRAWWAAAWAGARGDSYRCGVPDPFLVAAGPSPARGTDAKWRQVVLLSAASAINDADGAPHALASALHALDLPRDAWAIVERSDDADPWTHWWRVLCAGASEGLGALAEELSLAASFELEGPDSREVARRLADLASEVSALEGGEGAEARFALLGTGPAANGDGRRALLVGRSSASYLVVPRWDGVDPIRLAPSDGPSSGNRAHLRLAEIVDAICRGDNGAGRSVPLDVPGSLVPDDLLTALRQDHSERDQRLLALAQEVQEERAHLAEVKGRLEAERIALNAERRKRDRVASEADPAPTSEIPALPRDRNAAAALLGVSPTASAEDVERAYRAQIGKAHPDRVEGMHPIIRTHAQGLTVALNAARDLLLGRAGRRTGRGANAAS